MINMEKNECLKNLGSVIGALPFYLFTLLPFLAACGGSEKDYDATGTFEATETTVFAEQSGALLSFDVNEGDMIEAARQVGLIDTTQTWLKIQQMDATKAVYQTPARKPSTSRRLLPMCRRHSCRICYESVTS